MTPELYLLTAIIIIGFALVVWFLSKKLEKLQPPQEDTTLLEWAKTTQKDIKIYKQFYQIHFKHPIST